MSSTTDPKATVETPNATTTDKATAPAATAAAAVAASATATATAPAAPLAVATTTTTTRATTKVNPPKEWMDSYNELMIFLGQYGHVNVPHSWKPSESNADVPLGQWVYNQRLWYENLTNEKGELVKFDPIHQKQIDLLNELGFEWFRTVNNDNEWMEMYNRLKQYLKQHGHCNVPHQWKSNNKNHNNNDGDSSASKNNNNNNNDVKSLGKWVVAQRGWYRKNTNQNGELIEFETVLQRRIDLLNQIGFSWDQTTTKQKNWMAKYNELKKFHQQYGHTNVLRIWPPHKPLCKWIGVLQRWYQKHTNEQGELIKYDATHQEQLDLLNEIGFQWNPTKLPKVKVKRKYS